MTGKMKICLLLLVIAVLLMDQVDARRRRNRRIKYRIEKSEKSEKSVSSESKEKTWQSTLARLCELEADGYLTVSDFSIIEWLQKIEEHCPPMLGRQRVIGGVNVDAVGVLQELCSSVGNETRPTSEMKVKEAEGFIYLDTNCPKIIEEIDGSE